MLLVALGPWTLTELWPRISPNMHLSDRGECYRLFWELLEASLNSWNFRWLRMIDCAVWDLRCEKPANSSLVSRPNVSNGHFRHSKVDYLMFAFAHFEMSISAAFGLPASIPPSQRWWERETLGVGAESLSVANGSSVRTGLFRRRSIRL